MQPTTKFTIDLSTSINQREDHCAIHIKELGFTLYADSPEQTDEVLENALNQLFQALGGDIDRIKEYFDSKKIVYRTDDPTAEEPDPAPNTLHELEELFKEHIHHASFRAGFHASRYPIHRAQVPLAAP